jgi:hypothetical protein
VRERRKSATTPENTPASSRLGSLGAERSTARRFTIRRQFAKLVTSTLFAASVVSCQPTEQKLPQAPPSVPQKELAVEPDSPVPFGYKCAWLAIKTEDSQAVAQALGLQNGRKCGWREGIAAAYNGEVFVTPPVKGWVLAVSFALPEISEKTRPDQLSPLVKTLGKNFVEVQYFGTHRVVEYHGWLRATKGEIVRRYAYLGERGETLCDEGERTEEETKLGLIYNESKFPDEQHVMKLAGAWSIDPTSLDELKLEKSVGYLGSFPKK